MKRDLAEVGGENDSEGWGNGDCSEMGSATKKGKQKLLTCIDASLTPDFGDKDENNNNSVHIYRTNKQNQTVD